MPSAPWLQFKSALHNFRFATPLPTGAEPEPYAWQHTHTYIYIYVSLKPLLQPYPRPKTLLNSTSANNITKTYTPMPSGTNFRQLPISPEVPWCKEIQGTPQNLSDAGSAQEESLGSLSDFSCHETPKLCSLNSKPSEHPHPCPSYQNQNLNPKP